MNHYGRVLFNNLLKHLRDVEFSLWEIKRIEKNVIYVKDENRVSYQYVYFELQLRSQACW